MCVCINIYVYVYIMECYLPINQNSILPFATMWTDLEDIILSERSQRKTNTDKTRAVDY